MPNIKQNYISLLLRTFFYHLSDFQVVDVKQSSVNMVPSKVEITLRKADQVAWGKLEDPNYKPEPEPVENSFTEPTGPQHPDHDIDDDDISDSDEEWAYDTPANRMQEQRDREAQKKKEEEMQNLKRKEVEEEMKKATEERKRAEEERKKLEEQRMEEEQGAYEDMPDLE